MDDKISDVVETEADSAEHTKSIKPFYKEARFILAMVFCGIAFLCAVMSLIWNEWFFLFLANVMTAAFAVAVALALPLFLDRKFGRPLYLDFPIGAVLVELSAAVYCFTINTTIALFVCSLAGIILGEIALANRKKMCRVGKVLSTICVVLPAPIVLFIMLLFGASVVIVAFM